MAGKKAKLWLVSRYDILRHVPSRKISRNRLGTGKGRTDTLLLLLPLSKQTNGVFGLE